MNSTDNNPIITKMEYDGTANEIFKIKIKTAIYKMLTLGIYTFWGKTHLRHYILSSFSIDGDRLEYTGTGKEMFMGFIKVFPIWFILIGGLIFLMVALEGTGLDEVVEFFFSFLIFYIILVASYGSWKYRISRITWRGIRGYMGGSAWGYGAKIFIGWVLLVLSLNLLSPWLNHISYSKLVNNMYFGDVQVTYSGQPWDLLKIHLVTWVLMPFTLGLSRIWYQAAWHRYKYEHTHIGAISFINDETGMNLLGFHVKNTLILMFSFGVLLPYVIQNRMQYIADHVYFLGDLNAQEVKQAEGKRPKTGEGLENIFSSDAGMF